eukprot:2136265-Amphidinium_carterae.1
MPANSVQSEVSLSKLCYCVYTGPSCGRWCRSCARAAGECVVDTFQKHSQELAMIIIVNQSILIRDSSYPRFHGFRIQTTYSSLISSPP